MTENVVQIGKVEKAPRPPHVILLADVMGRLSQIPALDALTICWAVPDTPDGPAGLGSASVGSDASITFLLLRHLNRLVSGDLTRGPVPKDSP